jgi:hypothetical protein
MDGAIVTLPTRYLMCSPPTSDPKKSENYYPALIPLKDQEENHNLNFTSIVHEPYSYAFFMEDPLLTMEKAHDTSAGLDTIHDRMLNNLPTSRVKIL